MAELKSAVMALISVLFIATGSVSIFSYGITNNINNGGNSTSIPFPLANQTTAYTAQMNTFSTQLSNSTLAATEQPAASNAFTGIGALSQAGTAAISLSFSSMGMLITMVGSAGASLIPMGVPSFIFGFGVLQIAVGLGFAILAAVFKWWL